MSDNKDMSDHDDQNPEYGPTEVRSPIQAFVRIALAIAIVLLVGGTIWAFIARL